MTIRKMFGLRKTIGDVGVEIEMEGSRLPTEISNYWNVTTDGSLRGRGYEYVLNKPVKMASIEEALNLLHTAFDKPDTKLKPSDRCGVHVHVNVQEMDFTLTMTFITLYLLLEDLLVKFCGEDREGNLFCLRTKDAEGMIAGLVNCMQHQHFNPVQSDAFRYSSLNPLSLSKYGSLEFRAMRTPPDIRDILTWINLLFQLKISAQDFGKPTAVIENMSEMGSDRFLEQVLGGMAELVQCPDQEILLLAGVRRVQDIAYTQPVADFVQQYMHLTDEEMPVEGNRPPQDFDLDPRNPPPRWRRIAEIAEPIPAVPRTATRAMEQIAFGEVQMTTEAPARVRPEEAPVRVQPGAPTGRPRRRPTRPKTRPRRTTRRS